MFLNFFFNLIIVLGSSDKEPKLLKIIVIEIQIENIY